MTLRKFIEKYPQFSTCRLSQVPLKHPETGKKIYIVRVWFNGFLCIYKPGTGDGPMWPCQYCEDEDKEKLEVFPGAAKELRQRAKKLKPAKTPA